MASKMTTGDFTSQAVFNVTESGANTLTFEKLETGLSVYDKIGWVIARIEWRMSSGNFALFNASADLLTMALTVTNSLTTLSDDNPAILAIKRIARVDLGTAASGMFEPLDYVSDYSTLPGGGLLTLPNPLYMGLVGGSLTGAATVVTRIFFKSITLSDADYTNLMQSRQLLIST